MNQSELSLIFLDNPDPKIMYIQDTSVYNPDVEVENPLLKITPPNFSTQYVVEYPVSSLIVFNSNALGWTNTSDYEQLSVLPDGLWVITQSVKPNDCIYKTYNHFRIVNLKKSILCYVSEQLDSSDSNCDLSSYWYEDFFKLLQFLESAKYIAECCGNTKKATVMYNYVNNQFKKYNCQSGC